MGVITTYTLGAGEGSSQKTGAKVIIAHATGVDAPAVNTAIYEKREWSTSQAYVQYIVGDGGKIYKVGEEGYVAWGAGEWANSNAPVQIELAQTSDNAEFRKDYVAYVNLLRSSAKKWGIPVTLDSSAYTGIKTHRWITDHVWGDHTDPYGYLSRHGVSKAQFKKDVENGVSGGGSSSGSSSSSSKPSKPATKPKNYNNVDVSYALHQQGGSWLTEVKNFGSGSNGFAGVPNAKHDMLYVKVNHGSVKYRVHTLQDGWLPWVKKADKKDTVNGVAGIAGHTIDGVQIYFNTPSGEAYQQAYYRSQTTQRTGWLDVVQDDNNYAGLYGEPLDRLQVDVDSQSNY